MAHPKSVQSMHASMKFDAIDEPESFPIMQKTD